MGEVITNLPVASIIFFILFFVSSIAEVVFGLIENDKIRKIVKPFCLFFLSLAVLFANPNRFLSIFLGLLFGNIGDILLIFKEKKICLYLGIVSFFINHVFFIIFSLTLQQLNMAYITFVVFYVALIIGSFLPLKKLTKSTKIGAFGAIYSATIILDVILLITCCGVGKWNYMYFGLIGGLLFICSDTLLTYTIFIKKVKRQEGYIMLTYLLAEFLISIGYIFTVTLS